MLLNILYAILLTSLTVIIHGAYTFYLSDQLHKRHVPCRSKSHKFIGNLNLLSGLAVCLLLIHSAEAILWACFFLWQQALPDLETAAYFSLSSSSTIGYGDVLLPKHLRLVGAIEGLVGTLMCGWSVALLVAVIHNIMANKNAQAEEKK